MTPLQNAINNQPNIGYLAVGVFTALGALPVKYSEITVFNLEINQGTINELKFI